MKKLIIFISVLFWTFQSIHAQKQPKNIEVKWTKEKKSKKKFSLKKFIGFDNTGYYVWLSTGSSYSKKDNLLHYDKKFNLDKSAQLNLGKGSKKKKVFTTLLLNDKLYLFTTFKNRKNKKHTLYLQTVNKKTLQPGKELKKIASIDFGKKLFKNSGEFTIKISKDSTKVLVYYNLPIKKNESEKFGFKVFDQNMNELWQKDVTLPYVNKLFEFESFIVDNQGNVHILGKLYNEKRMAKRKGKVNYKYKILSYYNKGEELKKYDVRLKDKYINNVHLAINRDNNNLICAGFYSNKSDYIASGIYYLTIDHKTKNVIKESFKPFDAEFLTQYLKKSKKKKVKKRMKKGKETGLLFYELNDIITRKDGSVVLIGEYNKIHRYTSTTTDGNGNMRTTTYTNYIFGNIIVVNVTPDGQIQWAQKVPKLQVSVNREGNFTSFATMVTDDHIYLIYNDNPKNLLTSKNSKGKIYQLENPRKSIITVATLDNNGKLSRGVIRKPQKSKLYLVTRGAVQLDDKNMVIFAKYLKKYRFAQLIFKD